MSAMQDALTYPDSQVLINKLGITNAEQLRKTEYAVANARLRELRANPIQGNFDLAHLKQIHYFLLRDIYAWAGQTRDEVYITNNRFSKGNVLFSMQSEIQKDAHNVFKKLADQNYLKGNEKNKVLVISKLTDLYVGMNKIHPFREGNGRATQEFIFQLMKQAGYEIDYSKVDKSRWNASARDSAQGTPKKMHEVFNDITSPARAVAFDKLPAIEALKKHPELESTFQLLIEAKDFAQMRYQTLAEQIHFVRMTRAKISIELHKGNDVVGRSKESKKVQENDNRER